MELWEAIARESIRDLVARYNANGDSGRIEPMLELFAKDATYKVEDRVAGTERSYAGRDDIRTLFDGAKERTREGKGARFIRHNVATHQVDFSGPDAARGRCYYAVLTDRGLDHWGRYLDEYRLVDGRWLFQHRTCVVDARIEGGWGASGAAGSSGAS
jgi:3-phenylpropionate/cinnamic acid dioxygenase small subunit